MTIDHAIQAIDDFQGKSLTLSLSKIESAIVGLERDTLTTFCDDRSINNSFIASAVAVKRVAGQINVIIHAAGILCSLPHILRPGEKVESVSLGAGNTGRRFDLETSLRVAEYKFIDWQGGPESIRQNGLFKDFFELAEFETTKEKYLFVVGTKIPLRFLNGGRALTSVLSRYPDILQKIQSKYGPSVSQVKHYFRLKEREVNICDVSSFIGRDI